jgi:hypothetical protein
MSVPGQFLDAVAAQKGIKEFIKQHEWKPLRDFLRDKYPLPGVNNDVCTEYSGTRGNRASFDFVQGAGITYGSGSIEFAVFIY